MHCAQFYEWNFCPMTRIAAIFSLLLEFFNEMLRDTFACSCRQQLVTTRERELHQALHLNRKIEKIPRTQTMEGEHRGLQRLKMTYPNERMAHIFFKISSDGGAWDSVSPKRKFMQIYLWLSFIEFVWVRPTFCAHIFRIPVWHIVRLK